MKRGDMSTLDALDELDFIASEIEVARAAAEHAGSDIDEGALGSTLARITDRLRETTEALRDALEGKRAAKPRTTTPVVSIEAARERNGE